MKDAYSSGFKCRAFSFECQGVLAVTGEQLKLNRAEIGNSCRQGLRLENSWGMRDTD